MVAVRAKVGSRSFVRQKQLPKGRKTFKIDCSIPAQDGIFSEDVVSNFQQYFQDNVKLNGIKGKLNNKVRVFMKNNVLTVSSAMAYRKKYFKYLTKKFLKKKDLRDWLRILSTGKDSYQLKYFNIQDEEMQTVDLRQLPVTPEEVQVRQKVLLINTRNSMFDRLGSEAAKEGMSYSKFFTDVFLKEEDLHKEGVPQFDYVEMAPEHMKLSPDQGPDDWVALARLIELHYDKYAGFVIQNGTDSIVLTATALSFSLQNLGKPVIFTGSLIPGDCIYTDLKRNLVIALSVAQSTMLCEVCILFDENLFRANRTIRVAKSHLCPFDSPHYPRLGTIFGGEMKLRSSLLRPYPTGRLRVMPNLHTKVLILQLGPGLDAPVLLRFAQETQAKAIVLYCFGSGNGPTRDNYMKHFLTKTRERDILVVICTQNRYGSVKLEEYEGGRQIMSEGAVGAGSMTHEAALIKLKYLFGMGFTTDRVRKEFLRDLRGECNEINSKM
eukprot:gene10986-7630_t